MIKIKTYIIPLLQVMTLVFLLWITIQPVEIRWSDAEEILCYAIPIIGLLGMTLSLFRTSGGRLTIVDCLVCIWIIYYIGRVWIGAEYPCSTVFLQTMEMIMLYAVLRIIFYDNRIQPCVLCVGIMLMGCYEAIEGIGQLISGHSRHHIFAITGSFQNPGPYSAYLMMAGVIFLGIKETGWVTIKGEFGRERCFWKNNSIGQLILYYYSKIKFFGWNKSIIENIRCSTFYVLNFIFILPLLVLPLTWSRSAFVGIGVCALWIFHKKYWRYKWIVLGVLIAVAVGFYFIKRGSADGRTLIWMASITSWLHNPWLGVGVGGFCHACAEGIAEMWNENQDSRIFASAGVTDYAYNELLKVLVEQGLVGALLWIGIAIVALYRLYKVSKILFMTILSLLVFSMFSYPFELLPYRVLTVIIFAWSESSKKIGLYLDLKKTICIFATLILVTLSWFLKCEITERKEQYKNAFLFAIMQNSAFLTDYYELLPYENDNPQYLFCFAKTLRQEKRYKDSNAILRDGVMVSAAPIFYIIMGNNYRDEKMYDLAEMSYSKAYAVMPNRLYPLYQLMLLYDEMGESMKAREMAHTVLKAHVKIESGATEEMKKEAERIVKI
ncbi:MAG: O-antigen ligase family protein [Bacteroidaceae bacterium]|nr:O-antigen ligase family protein [Bacteroidaceae bacterium]